MIYSITPLGIYFKISQKYTGLLKKKVTYESWQHLNEMLCIELHVLLAYFIYLTFKNWLK